MLTIIADTCGRHDTLGGACAAESNTVRYALEKKAMHACRDSFLLAVAENARHGLTKRDITHNINFFMNVPVTPDGGLTFADGVSAPGQVRGDARRDGRLVLISNCPQLNNPCNAYNPTPIEVLIWELRRLTCSRKVLIANRGAIACRIIRTLDRMGVASVAVYSEADAHALHVGRADEAVSHRAGAGRRELSQRRSASSTPRARTGAEAIHPGYGFLSENAGLRRGCEQAGIAFIGPPPEQMRAFGLKHTARALAAAAACRCCRARVCSPTPTRRAAEAARIGYPVMLKSTAGGGGIGMQLCRDAAELARAFERVRAPGAQQLQGRAASSSRSSSSARATSRCRSSATARATCVALGERDCSVQRRNQKVIEETPAPGPAGEPARALARRGRAARPRGELPLGRHRRVRLRRRHAARSTSSR